MYKYFFYSLLSLSVLLSACGGGSGGSTVAPTAPTNLVVLAGPGYITLSWQDNSSDETEFDIFRRTASQQTFAQLSSVAKDVTSFKDSTAELGQNYQYAVTAKKGSLSSGQASHAGSVSPNPFEAEDKTPDLFSFTDILDAEPGAVLTSNSITVSGINAPTDISVNAGTLLIDNKEVPRTTIVSNGQSVSIRLQASTTSGATVNAKLSIGSLEDTYSITTKTAGPDTTPNPFSFNSVLDAELEAVYTSNAITVTGIDTPSPISVEGAILVVDGQDDFKGSTVNNGQTVALRLSSSAEYSTTQTATLTIGGVSANYSVTSKAAPPIITVQNTNDSGEGSLRQAVLDATDGTLINFSETVRGTITLTSQILIDKNIDILGPGSSELSLSANNSNRHFVIATGKTTNISNLSLLNGLISGTIDNDGGSMFISPQANVTLRACNVSNNSSNSGGGAIYADQASLTIDDCTFSGNSAASGGAIWSSSSTNIYTEVIFAANTAAGVSSSDGGAVVIAGGSFNMSGLTVSNNSTVDGGGGLELFRTTGSINASNFSANTTSNSGGAIRANESTVTISDSTLSSNSATNFGGGIVNFRGKLTLENTIIQANAVTANFSDGGGIYNDASTQSLTLRGGRISSNTTPYYGGGIAIANGTYTITNTEIHGNSAGYGAGIYVYDDDGSITNSSFYENNASTAGGALYSRFANVTVVNSTISNNLSPAAGGIYLAASDTLTLRSSTVSSNQGGGLRTTKLTTSASIIAQNLGSDISGLSSAVTSLGYNLIGNGTDTGLTNGINNDLVGSVAAPINPLLDSLADNGGPTRTRALLASSPARAHIPGSFCPNAADQRGLPRPGSDGKCDIGAFEVQ